MVSATYVVLRGGVERQGMGREENELESHGKVKLTYIMGKVVNVSSLSLKYNSCENQNLNSQSLIIGAHLVGKK